MKNTLIAKAKLGRAMALNALSARRNGEASNIVNFAATPSISFTSVRGHSSLSVESAVLLAEPGELRSRAG